MAFRSVALPSGVAGSLWLSSMPGYQESWTAFQAAAAQAKLAAVVCLTPRHEVAQLSPAQCHVHHCWWWSRGGPTDIENAALLCGFHHRMVHRQDWAITLAPNGYPQLHPPPHIDPTGRARQHHRFTVHDALRPTGDSAAGVTDPVAPHRRT